jgi:hypothetical protein
MLTFAKLRKSGTSLRRLLWQSCKTPRWVECANDLLPVLLEMFVVRSGGHHKVGCVSAKGGTVSSLECVVSNCLRQCQVVPLLSTTMTTTTIFLQLLSQPNLDHLHALKTNITCCTLHVEETLQSHGHVIPCFPHWQSPPTHAPLSHGAFWTPQLALKGCNPSSTQLEPGSLTLTN